MIIWLASYPRSGNTFCRAVLNHYFGKHSFSIYGDPRDIGSNAGLGALVGHAANAGNALPLDELRASDERYFIKTHEAPDVTLDGNDLAFYIVRDGRDACASYLRYLHKVAGREDVSLPMVIAGATPFGSWGRHTLQWFQAQPSRAHRFKFEEITKDPDAFAERIAEILVLERSDEPFPEFETFRKAAPSFFGSGGSGAYESIFSSSDLALFDLYQGPAMRLAGYAEGDLTEDEIRAYSLYSAQMHESSRERARERERVRARLEALEAECAMLERTVNAAENEIELVRQDLSAATHKHQILNQRYERVLRYTGLAAIRPLLRKFRSTD